MFRTMIGIALALAAPAFAGETTSQSLGQSAGDVPELTSKAANSAESASEPRTVTEQEKLLEPRMEAHNDGRD
jgi:hypothetical protein